MGRWSTRRAAVFGAAVGFLHAIFLVVSHNHAFNLVRVLSEVAGMAALWFAVAAIRNRLKSAS